MARVFPFILKAKYETLHVIWAWAELEILLEKKKKKKKNLHEVQSIESNF